MVRIRRWTARERSRGRGANSDGQQRSSGRRARRRRSPSTPPPTAPPRRPPRPPPKVEHFTPAERAARGKAARAEVPRSSHADWEPSPIRPDPVDILEAQAASREPSLVPIRYGRMLVTPFTFYRGAAALMAADLSGGPRSGLHTQLCGDAHLMNFGSYAAPDRRMVFGINDFDESLPGPVRVGRQAARRELRGRRPRSGLQPEGRGPRSTPRSSRRYREAMQGFAAMRNLDLWYARLDVDARIKEIRSKLDAEAVARMEKNVEKARTKDSLKAFSKLVTAGGRRAPDHERPAADRADRRARAAGAHDDRRTRPSRASSAPTGAPCRPTGASCSSASATSTWRARSSASAASAPGRGSS